MENNFDVILYSNGNIQFSNSYVAPTLAKRKQFMGNCDKICAAKQSAKVKQLRTKTSLVTKQASRGQSKETAGWQEQEMTQKTPLPTRTKGAAQRMKANAGDNEMCTQAMGQGVLF